jgi:hypothetical protein
MSDINSKNLNDMFADLNQKPITSITLIWGYVQIQTDDHTINLHPSIILKIRGKHYDQNQITIAIMQANVIGQTITDMRTVGKNIIFAIGSCELIFEIGKSASGETLQRYNRRNPQITYAI